MNRRKCWSGRKAQECLNKSVQKNFWEKNKAPTMLRKKSASIFPKADFSIWLSGTPVIWTGRTDKTAFRPVDRPSAQKKTAGLYLGGGNSIKSSGKVKFCSSDCATQF